MSSESGGPSAAEAGRRLDSGMDLSELETDLLRRMTPAKKLEVMTGLIRQAYELKAAGIRARWPDLPEDEVRARTRTLVAGDRP